jgi:uncharacterized protein (TIGR03083 family)
MRTYITPYADRDTLLEALAVEEGRLVALVGDPGKWGCATHIDGWTVQDVACHLVDETEDYLKRWDMARRGEPSEVLDLATFREQLREGARAYRHLAQDEAVARFTAATSDMMAIFRGVTEQEWNRLNVSHPLFGSMPSAAFPAIQLADYMLHSWDIHWGLGDPTAKLDDRSAGTLMPHMFNVWHHTFNRDAAAGQRVAYGIRTEGPSGGQWKVTVSDGQFVIEAAKDLSDVPAIFRYAGAAELLLTRFHRIKGGTASGDPEAIGLVGSLFSGL